MKAVETGKRVLRIEAEALGRLSEALGEPFEKAVDILLGCEGKVILTGMGKSGIICRKIAATLSSTGTPSFFLHPAEGAHGDLGMLSSDDVVIALSNSGATDELVGLLPLIRGLGLPLIAITGAADSILGRRADVTLHIDIVEEGCPLDLAPMASTTAALALGDALSASLMERRGVSAEDFARFHPAGALGRRLTLQVDDLMYTGKRVPKVSPQTVMREALLEMTEKGLGLTGVFDGNDLIGVVTDGDLRRIIRRDESFLDLPAKEVMTHDPKTIEGGTLAFEALQTMEKHNITALFVITRGGVAGVVHLHDLVKAGLQ